MGQNSAQERRQHPRVGNNIPVKICSPEADLVTETKNISCSGTYCRVSKYLEPMTKIKITLLLPVKKESKMLTKKVSCTGVIVRMENIPDSEEFFAAVFFSDIHPKDSRILAEFVNGVLVNSEE